MKDTENASWQLAPPLKRAVIFKNWLQEENLTVTEIAQKINKSVPFVSNTLRLLKLPELVKEGLLSGIMSEGHARALGMAKNEGIMTKIYKEILVERISVRRTERLVREESRKK